MKKQHNNIKKNRTGRSMQEWKPRKENERRKKIKCKLAKKAASKVAGEKKIHCTKLKCQI